MVLPFYSEFLTDTPRSLDVVNMPGKMAIGSIRKDPLKKTAFSDRKNTFSNNNSTPQANKSSSKLAFGGAFSSALKAKPTTTTPKPQLMLRTDLAKMKISNFGFAPERPLQPVDFQRCHAEMWVLNDTQIDRLMSLRDTPSYMKPVPVPAKKEPEAALRIWEDDWADDEPVKELEEPLAPLPDLDLLDMSVLDEVIGWEQQNVATRNSF